jgi:plasmid stability protein
MGASVTIRDIPDKAHAELVARAAVHGQSLQEYLRRRMCDLTSKPDMKTLMAEIRDWKKQASINVSMERILAELDAERQ